MLTRARRVLPSACAVLAPGPGLAASLGQGRWYADEGKDPENDKRSDAGNVSDDAGAKPSSEAEPSQDPTEHGPSPFPFAARPGGESALVGAVACGPVAEVSGVPIRHVGDLPWALPCPCRRHDVQERAVATLVERVPGTHTAPVSGALVGCDGEGRGGRGAMRPWAGTDLSAQPACRQVEGMPPSGRHAAACRSSKRRTACPAMPFPQHYMVTKYITNEVETGFNADEALEGAKDAFWQSALACLRLFASFGRRREGRGGFCSQAIPGMED